MATWRYKDMGVGVQANAPTEALFAMITALAVPDGLRRGVGVFSRYDLERNIVTWYFSPEAEAAALAFGATPCEKPSPGRGFGLLTGRQDAWESHFPEYYARVRGDTI